MTKALGQSPTFSHFQVTEKWRSTILNHRNSVVKTDDIYTDLFSFPTSNTNQIGLNAEQLGLLLRFLTPLLNQDGLSASQSELTKLAQWKKEFNHGVDNYEGFQWKKPYGYLSVSAKRKFSVNAQGTIDISDLLELEINAESLLKHMSDHEFIAISSDELSLFAGIKYHKIFEFKHHALSMKEALLSPLRPLVLPFQYLTFPFIYAIKEGEELSNKDFLSLNVNGGLSVSFYPWLSAGISVHGSFDLINNVYMRKKIDGRREERYLVQRETSQKASLGVEASLNADLLKFINLTLLKVHYETRLLKEKKYYYEFSKSDLVQNAPTQSFLSLLWGTQQDQQILSQFLMGSEIAVEKETSGGSDLFFWGNSSSKSHKQSILESNQTKVVVDEYAFKQTRFSQGILAGTISTFMGDFLGSFIGPQKMFLKNQSINSTYISENDLYELTLNQLFYLNKFSSSLTSSKKSMLGKFIGTSANIPSPLKMAWWNAEMYKNISYLRSYTLRNNDLYQLIGLEQDKIDQASRSFCQLPLSGKNHLKWKEKSCLKRFIKKLNPVVRNYVDFTSHKSNVDKFLTYYIKKSKGDQALQYLFSLNNYKLKEGISYTTGNGARYQWQYLTQQVQAPLIEQIRQRLDLWY
jgi:hypothetical protein